MTIDRAIDQIYFALALGNGYKRCAYARKKHIFAELGENVKLPLTLPLYPQLIKIHNNVKIHHSVKLITHDRINAFLSNIPDAYQFKQNELLGPIEIMDNVYIGMNVIILGNVKIGPNVIVNAGSVIVSDIPPNSVVSGVPAKVVGQFDILMKSHIMMDRISKFHFKRSGKESIDAATVAAAWDIFDKKKNKTTKTCKDSASQAD